MQEWVLAAVWGHRRYHAGYVELQKIHGEGKGDMTLAQSMLVAWGKCAVQGRQLSKSCESQAMFFWKNKRFL